MLVPLAGGGQETLLSEVGFALLPLFTTRDACALRLVCRELLAAVTEQPWEDAHTVITGSLAAWRACFPRALAANVTQVERGSGWRTTPVLDADLVPLRGLRALNMAGCTSITGVAFARHSRAEDIGLRQGPHWLHLLPPLWRGRAVRV